MQRALYLAFFSLLFLLNFAAVADSSKPHEASISDNSGLPYWPFAALTKKERTARLELFMRKVDFQFAPDNSTGSKQQCENLFSKIKDSNSVTILEPKYLKIGSKLPVTSSCENLKEAKLYVDPFKDFKPIDDAVFMSFTNNEKDTHPYISYQATTNIEYYDLSPYFNEQTWGYLGEGVIKKCNETVGKYCPAQPSQSFENYKGTMAFAFNPETCRVKYYPSQLYNYRFSPITAFAIELGKPEKNVTKYSYGSKPTFTSIMAINDKPYLVTLDSQADWNLHSEIDTSRAEMDIQSIDIAAKTSDIPTCKFEFGKTQLIEMKH